LPTYPPRDLGEQTLVHAKGLKLCFLESLKPHKNSLKMESISEQREEGYKNINREKTDKAKTT
jgi:hypothetical protein